MRFDIITISLFGAAALATPVQESILEDTGPPPPPDPEPIEVSELPLPPVTPSTAEGSCTPEINPHRTGCVGKSVELQSGGFLPDGNHVTATVLFTGAPAAPDPASIYAGQHIILVKTDGTTFPNGDPWKCVTCGVPEKNTIGRSEALDYPQAFNDGKRILAGTNIIDCGNFSLTSPRCTPQKVHIYPIRWNVTPDGSGPGGDIRELRLHPDNVHLGYSSTGVSSGKFAQFGYLGRLEFNALPKTGEPPAPRYDLAKVTRLFDPAGKPPISVSSGPDGNNLMQINPDAITVGELRGFSGRGKEVTYLGAPVESCNIDVFAADLTTGKVRRLTSHPEYVDPVDISPDDGWTAVMDTRGTDRQMFLAGMRGIPPVTDMITTSTVSSVRNNGQRRFFQPYLIDRYGDRGSYFGQQINAAGDGSPGSVNDPEWNGMADPKWSPDGTRIVYWQHLTVPPACGGKNPLPCQPSTAPGGRTERMMIAHLTSRKPLQTEPVTPTPDTVPWGTPYEPGSPTPALYYPPQGTYILKGKDSGFAEVVITEDSNRTAIRTVAVTYHGYSDDGANSLDGSEKVTAHNPSPTLNKLDWYSDLVQTGLTNSTKQTSPGGFHVSIDILTNHFQANGTLTTIVNGHVYRQPANGT